MPVMSLDPDRQALWESYPIVTLDDSKTVPAHIWPIYWGPFIFVVIIGIYLLHALPKRTMNDQFCIGYDMGLYIGQDVEEFRLNILEAKEAYQKQIVILGKRRVCNISPRHIPTSADAKTKGTTQT